MMKIILGNKVEKQYPKAEIIFFSSGEELLLSDKYIVFLDIQMSGRTTIFLEKGKVLLAKRKFPEFVKKYMKYIQRRG